MNANQIKELARRDTDIDGALRRFSGNEDFYTQCLQAFLEDTTMTELSSAIHAKSWDDAFTAAHALKGLAGNMGFIPLMHSIGSLVILIRNGKVNEIDDAMDNVREKYREISETIRRNFISSGVKA